MCHFFFQLPIFSPVSDLVNQKIVLINIIIMAVENNSSLNIKTKSINYQSFLSIKYVEMSGFKARGNQRGLRSPSGPGAGRVQLSHSL